MHYKFWLIPKDDKFPKHCSLREELCLNHFYMNIKKKVYRPKHEAVLNHYYAKITGNNESLVKVLFIKAFKSDNKNGILTKKSDTPEVKRVNFDKNTG